MSDERLVARDTRTLPFLWISRALIDTTLAKMPRNRRQRALRTYTALAYYATHAPKCAVEIRKLGEIVGDSTNTVKRGIEDLVKARAIRVKARFSRKGGKRVCLPNEYTLIDLGEPKKTAI